MSKVLSRAALVVFLVATVLVSSPAFAQNDEAQVRVAHLSPDAPNVDVYVNDAPVNQLTNVPFGTVSSYLPLPAGPQDVKVFAAGDTSEPVIEANVELQNGAAYTIGAVGLVRDGSLKAQVYEDDTSLPTEGNAKLRVVHAAPDVGAVDIGPQGGQDLFTELGFPNATRYNEVPAGTYTLEGTDTELGQIAFSIPDVTLSANTVYTAFATGLSEEGTFTVKLVEDATTGNPQAAEPMPDTGGISPVQLALVAVAIFTTVFLVIRYWRARFTSR